MRIIGIRAEPNNIYYVIMDHQNKEITIIEKNKLDVPKALGKPEQLKYIRNTFLDIFREYGIENAGIREAEAVARPNIDRIGIEAILQEMIASSDIKKYFIGKISTIASKNGFPTKDFKLYIEGKKSFEDFPEFDKFNKYHKECTLTALGAIDD